MVATVVIIVGMADALVFAVFSGRTLQDIDDALVRRTAVFLQSRSYRQAQIDRPINGAASPTATGPPGLPSDAIIFVYGIDPSGHEHPLTGNVAADSLPLPEGWADPPVGTPMIQTVTLGGSAIRVALIRPADATHVTDSTGSHRVTALLVGETLDRRNATLGELELVLIVGGCGATVLSLAAGLVAARSALSPVRALAAGVADLNTTAGLRGRVPLPRSRDEIFELARAFNTALAEIQTLYEEQESALDRQRAFVGDAAHELRTPLSAIKTEIELLRRHPGLTEERRLTVVARAASGVSRLDAVLDTLLRLARADEASAVAATAVDWDEVFGGIASAMQERCAPRRVVVLSEGTLGSAYLDLAVVHQIFVILADNVVAHTSERTEVTLRATPAPADVTITVTDDGPGVPVAMLPRIFGRFVQADLSRHRGGTGLGLAIAHRLTTLHGGTITAAPAHGHGLSITVALPREPGKSEDPRPSDALPSVDGDTAEADPGVTG